MDLEGHYSFALQEEFKKVDYAEIDRLITRGTFPGAHVVRDSADHSLEATAFGELDAMEVVGHPEEGFYYRGG